MCVWIYTFNPPLTLIIYLNDVSFSLTLFSVFLLLILLVINCSGASSPSVFQQLHPGCIGIIVSGGIPTNTAVITAAVVPVVGIKVLQWVHDRWRRRTIGCRLRRRRRKCRCLRWYRWETASIGCWLLHPPLIPPTKWFDCDWSDQLAAMLFILTINDGCTEELTSRWNKNNGSRILYN